MFNVLSHEAGERVTLMRLKDVYLRYEKTIC